MALPTASDPAPPGREVPLVAFAPLTATEHRRRRALVHGTFDPAHTRNRMLLSLLASAGWDARVLRRDVWGSDRFSAVRADRLGLAIRARARAYARLVLQAVTTARPDVVVFLYPGHVDMLVLAPVWKLRGVPVVFDPLLSLHDTVVSDRAMVGASSPKARLLAMVDRTAFALADVVVVDTPEVGAFYAERFGLRADKALVVWPGTDVDRLGVPADDGGIPGRILFHGSFIPLHGVETIVRAAALLADTDLRFRLVGNGQQRPAVEALIRELGGVPGLTLVDAMPLERHRRRDPGRVALPRHLRHHSQGRPGRAVQGLRVHGARARRSSPATRRPPATRSAPTWCSCRRATRPRSPTRSAR